MNAPFDRLRTAPIYQLRQVTKSYQEREVCRVEALDIYPGEILGIMGPNGAGKSTLLRLLNFLESPTSGRIRFVGTNANGDVPLALRRQVTMVFQRPVLFSGSVGDNVAYGLRLRGDRGVEVKVKEALARVGLEGMISARVSTLSGGEAQRVALARALAIEPQVLLLDEPTANLDPYHVAVIEDLVTTINRERGTTIVLVTHNVFQARRLAHRVALLLEGRTIEIGETAQVFSQPQDPRTAAFIRGEMVY